MVEVKQIFLTIDVDFTDYVSGDGLDELEITFEDMKSVLLKYPEMKTTWFIRIDNHIRDVYGKPDHIFIKHAQKIKWLKNNGHSIGWHHHAYKLESGKWQQELNESLIINDLKINAEIALNYGMSICRMGWGYHTNKTMEIVNDMGFKIDSSAIPRPSYKWDLSKKDWSTSPQQPYHPSRTDYRVPGKSNLSILEVPISTVELSLPSDTEQNVLRYINPLYRTHKFKEAMINYACKNTVLIFHPYEIIEKRSKQNSLLSFDINTLKDNIEFILNKGYKSSTLESLLNYKSINNEIT